MLNMPILKFEKSSKYLESQLEIQSNNKQLILDIITNIGLIISSSSKEHKNNYTEILDSANKFLHSISGNITAIEQLNLEIANITKELSDLLQEQSKATKTKEYYIAAFSNIKQNIVLYSKKFQNIEEKLNIDNKSFNEFININNFKYNFNSTDTNEDSNSYEFTGFSINETSEDAETNEITIDDISLDDMADILEDSIDSSDDISLDNDVTVDENIESTEDVTIDENTETTEDVTSDDTDVTIDENIESIESITSENTDVTIDENIETTEDVAVSENTETTNSNNFINDFVETVKFTTNTSTSFNEKIEKLTNEFKQFLVNLSSTSTETNLQDESIDINKNNEVPTKSLISESIETEENLNEELLSSLSDEDLVNELLLDSVSDIDLPSVEITDESNIISDIDEEISNNATDKLITDTILEEEILNETIVDNLDKENLNKSTDEENILEKEILDEITEELIIDTALNEENSNQNIDTQSNTDTSEKINSFNIADINFIKNKQTFYTSDLIFDIKKSTNDMSPVFFKGNRNIKPEVEEIFEEYLEDIEEDEENTENSNNNVELSINDNIETTNNTSVENELSTEFINIDENLNINENTNNTVPENISNTFIDIEKLISNINNPQIEEETNTDSIENKFQDIKSTFNEIEEIINNNKKNDSDSEINTNKATSNINNNYGLNIDTTNTEIIDDSFDKSEINLFDINLATAVEQNLIANYINQPTTPTPQDFDENLDVSSQESHTFDFNQKIDEEKVVDVITNFEENIDEKIQHILEAAADNENLIISEKHQKIYLPYKISELVNYMDSYPNVYSSLQDVVKQEFILPFDYFMKHPYKSRFSETYNIIKNREGKNVVKAFCYSLNVSKRNNLNPAVIAACKSLNELETYLYYLDSNNLKRFKFFNIIYEVNLA